MERSWLAIHTTSVHTEWVAHHNGDYSGDVTFTNLVTKAEIVIPFSALEVLVAAKVRDTQVDFWENADVEDVHTNGRSF